jgi:hypothetical protein
MVVFALLAPLQHTDAELFVVIQILAVALMKMVMEPAIPAHRLDVEMLVVHRTNIAHLKDV